MPGWSAWSGSGTLTIPAGAARWPRGDGGACPRREASGRLMLAVAAQQKAERGSLGSLQFPLKNVSDLESGMEPTSL